jgi:hypothetical protein
LVPTGVDSRLDASSSSREESREIIEASVEAELVTLAELASIEFRVDARLCFDALRRNMLSGRDVAPEPGLRVVVDLGAIADEAHIRPKNREAALVVSDVRLALAVTTNDRR